MLPSIATQTVYRLRGTPATDEYQSEVLDWSDPERRRIDGCVFQPLPGDEFNQGRDAVTTRWEWFGPPNSDVTSQDRIEYRGVFYEVDGSVGKPEGLGLDHDHAICRRVDG